MAVLAQMQRMQQCMRKAQQTCARRVAAADLGGRQQAVCIAGAGVLLGAEVVAGDVHVHAAARRDVPVHALRA